MDYLNTYMYTLDIFPCRAGPQSGLFSELWTGAGGLCRHTAGESLFQEAAESQRSQRHLVRLGGFLPQSLGRLWMDPAGK